LAVKADNIPGTNAYSLVRVAGVVSEVLKQLAFVPIGHWMEEA
jgi:chorismate-pyruvate lyase